MKYKSSLSQKNLSSADKSFSKNYSLKDFIRQINLHNPKLKKIEALLHGRFESINKGDGFNFNEIREYKLGDDLRNISWTTTAKTGILHIKEYLSEKEIKTYFIADISNSMFCGNKLNIFIQLFAFLLNTSLVFSEKIGGLFFSRDVRYFFPLMHSANQANIIFQTLLNHIDNKLTSQSNQPELTNISGALDFSKRYFRKKGLIILISDFINLNKWEKTLYEMTQKYNIYSFQVYDKVDYFLPRSGYVSIIDPETQNRLIVNTDNELIQKAYENEMKTRNESLKLFLNNLNIHHAIIGNEYFE